MPTGGVGINFAIFDQCLAICGNRWNGRPNKKSYALYRTLTIPMTLSDIWRSFHWPAHCCYCVCAAADRRWSVRDDSCSWNFCCQKSSELSRVAHFCTILPKKRPRRMCLKLGSARIARLLLMWQIPKPIYHHLLRRKAANASKCKKKQET